MNLTKDGELSCVVTLAGVNKSLGSLPFNSDGLSGALREFCDLSINVFVLHTTKKTALDLHDYLDH